MAELQVATPDGAERKVPLGGKAVSIGRSEECDVVIAEGKASRRHCRIEPKGDGWRVVDEGSSNGTWLGGKPVLAARLKPGDELEIGETVLIFLDESAPPPPREPRKPRAPKKKPTPWGALFVPLLVAGVAFGVASKFEKSEGADAGRALVRYAATEAERASLEKDETRRKAAIEELRRVLARLPNSAAALASLDTPADGGAAGGPDKVPAARDDWRAALEALDADKSVSAAERKSRLAELLERHLDEADAITSIRDRVETELTAAGERIRLDREQAFADADRASAEGRYGLALTTWLTWVQRVPSISAEDNVAIAERMNDLIVKSRAAAEEAATQYDAARREGRGPAAQAILDAAAERLAGTGFDVWLAARGAGAIVTRGPDKRPGPEKTDDASTRERTRALQLSGDGERIVRTRRFGEAAAKLDEAAAAVSDKLLKADIQRRADDVKAEASFFSKLLAAVAAEPKKFSPVKMGDHLVRIGAATESEISIVGPDGTVEARPVADVPVALLAQLVEKSVPEKGDLVSAALLLRDLQDLVGYTKWMRAALVIDDIRIGASEVHARYMGQPMPDGGYLPHPNEPNTIVTAQERKRIENDAHIKDLCVQFAKIADKIEKSKQAKAVDNVRKAYMKLEEARNFALQLIFDEVKYFYPYRDRMKEYAPVQHEVDERVKAVRDAWADKTAEKVRTDATLDKLMSETDKLVTEIQYYGGSPEDLTPLVARVDAVRMYLGHDISVQTFYENQLDLDRMAYNGKVLKYNLTAKGPTEPERDQVRITNEYRLMFGHRRMLRINAMLVTSARGHSDDMSKLGFFDHFSPVEGKRSPEDRMKLAGYAIAGGSENIYQGSGSPEAAHQGWIHSSGHHRNILTPAWVEMGSGNGGNLWTQNFGFRMDDDWEGGVPK